MSTYTSETFNGLHKSGKKGSLRKTLCWLKLSKKLRLAAREDLGIDKRKAGLFEYGS